MKNINNKLKVENWPIDKLIPYARNPRINDDAVPKLAGLIKEFGFKVPIVITSDGGIIDGHERYKAALLLGLNDVPVTIADEWTPAQVKAFRIAANKSSEWAEWDYELLRLEVEDLKLENYDLELIDCEEYLIDNNEKDLDSFFESKDIIKDENIDKDDDKEIIKDKGVYVTCPYCKKKFTV